MATGFEYQIDMEVHNLQFVIRINPADPPPLKSARKGTQSATAEIEVDLDPTYLPTILQIQPAGNLAIAPLKYRLSSISDLKKPIPLDLHFPEGTPLNFYVDISSMEDSSYHASFEIYGPPYRVLEWGQKSLPSRWPISKEESETLDSDDYWQTFDEVLKDVCVSVNAESSASAITEFTNELGRWIPAWEMFYLIDHCKRAHEKYSGHSDKAGLTKYFAQQLINQPDSADFEFDTWNKFVQFTDTTQRLPTIPTLTTQEIIKKAVKLLLDNETPRTHPIDLLWGLELRYDISAYELEALTEEETNVLLAKSIIEGDYACAERIITALDTEPPEGELDALISKASEVRGEESLKRSGNLLQPTISSDKSRFLEVAGNYFRNLERERDFTLPANAAIHEALAKIYSELDKPNFERTAHHYYNYYRGIRFLRVERYQEAAETLERSISKALDEHSIYGDIRFTQLHYPFIHYYRAISGGLQRDKKFSEAAQRLNNEAIPIVDQLDYFQSNQREKEYTRNRLQALFLEAEGNRYLHNQELTQAASQFGQAVGILHQINRGDEAEYFENRRRSIEAALAEQEGNFAGAAQEHENIVESLNGENNFARFHRARAKICRSKDLIMEWDFESARQSLLEIDVEWGIAGDEIQYLELLLNELETYEEGSTSDINQVLDELNELSLDTNEDLHVSYGHDYRPVFINILAAQKMKQFDDLDSISKALIEISLSDVLRPNQVTQVIERRGLSNIQLDQQWMERVPIFTLNQYQEVEKSEAGKISTDNYKDQGDALTGSLEQYLHFIAEYYGRMEYGPEWQSRISASEDGPSLRDLADFLNNNLFDELSWIETVREVLFREKYEDIVMPSKDGHIVDVRNDIDHNSISHLNEKDFFSIKSDIQKIFQESSMELPVLGKVLGQNEYGAYTVHLFIGGTKNEIEIMTDKKLDEKKIYYFPPDTPASDPVENIDSEMIVLCEAHRVKKGLNKYGQLSIDITTE